MYDGVKGLKTDSYKRPLGHILETDGPTQRSHSQTHSWSRTIGSWRTLASSGPLHPFHLLSSCFTVHVQHCPLSSSLLVIYSI